MTFRLSYEHSVKVVYLQGCLRNIAQENVDSTISHVFNGCNVCKHIQLQVKAKIKHILTITTNLALYKDI